MVTVLIPVPLSALLMGALSPTLCTQSEAGHPLWGESPTESPLVLPAPPWLSLVQGATTSPAYGELPSQELPPASHCDHLQCLCGSSAPVAAALTAWLGACTGQRG